MNFCEIRVPTYKRPAWLKRALSSLIAQDYPHWKAIVMDDSTDQEAISVIESLGDNRIIYSPNPKNIGCAANLDRAFASQGLIGGTYAYVLEDDNWLMPNFLLENIRALESSSVNIILRNQEVWEQSENKHTSTGQTTRGFWFEQKIYQPLELYASLFFFEGISNGGLFWRTSVKSNFQVGNTVTDSGLQEYCRTIQIIEPIYFTSNPLCVWSKMQLDLSSRNSINNRVFGKGQQVIAMYLLEKYEQKIVEVAKNIALRVDKMKELEMSLLNALYLNYSFCHIDKLAAFKNYFKSYAKYIFIGNPLNKYFVEMTT